MILSTTDTVEGRPTVKVLGVVSGSTVRARNIGRDITALFRNVVGGEVSEYTLLLAQSREEALQRMKDVAVEGCQCHSWHAVHDLHGGTGVC